MFILLNEGLADCPSEGLDYSLRTEVEAILSQGTRIAGAAWECLVCLCAWRPCSGSVERQLQVKWRRCQPTYRRTLWPFAPRPSAGAMARYYSHAGRACEAFSALQAGREGCVSTCISLQQRYTLTALLINNPPSF